MHRAGRRRRRGGDREWSRDSRRRGKKKKRERHASSSGQVPQKCSFPAARVCACVRLCVCCVFVYLCMTCVSVCICLLCVSVYYHPIFWTLRPLGVFWSVERISRGNTGERSTQDYFLLLAPIPLYLYSSGCHRLEDLEVKTFFFYQWRNIPKN